jgi:tetratricopeptide (TPR) repeat protein
MPSASEDTAELDSADLVEAADVVPLAPEDTNTAKRGKGAERRADAAAASRRGAPPPTFPDVDALIAEARRRAQLSGQLGDRVILARARTELAILLEVLKSDTTAALAEYRAAHAMAPAALAPIAAARRLTPLRPIAPALALLEAELRATTDQKTRGARLLELGRMLLAGGAAPEKTVQAFRDVLAIVPDDPAALRGLERALRAMPRALENPPTLELLAAHLDAMSTAWRNDRRLSAWLQVERASILERLRKPEAARAALEVGLELDGGVGPVRDAYTRHLIAHDGVKLLSQAWSAEAWLEGDCARAGRLLYASARLASERLNKPAQAIEWHRRAVALTATAPATRLAALRELERLHAEAGDLSQSVQADKELLAWVQGAELAHRHRRLAQALEKLEQWEEVVTHAGEVLVREPDDEDTRERFDRALSVLGRHEQRTSFWTAESSRIALPAARVEALVRAAHIAERDLERPDLALVDLRAAWAIDPENSDVADAIARLLMPGFPPSPADPEDPSLARARIDFYTEAAGKAVDPGRKVAQLEKLAQVWEDEVRDPEKAMETFREILAVEPDRRSAILGLERNAARAGDARALFRALVLEADLAKDPALVRSLLLRAAEIASVKLNDADTALDLVERILQKNPGDPLALRVAGRIHQRTGHFEEAAAQLRLLLQHTRRGPGSFAIAVELASLLDQKLRRRDEALGAYREAFRNDPAHPLPKAEIRRILFASGDHRMAADELVTLSAAAQDPAMRGRLLLEAAEIYADRLHDADKAVALLNQARPLLPGDIEVRERLERAYLRLGKTGELAVLLDTSRTTPGETFTLGWLLTEDRDWVRATKLLESVLAQDGHHVPALRALEHALTRTEQWPALDALLRAEGQAFETREARLGSLNELVYLEEYRGVAAAAGSAPASELIRRVAADDLLAHEAILKQGFVVDSPASLPPLIRSLDAVALGTPDAHHAAALQLIAALLLERAAPEHDESSSRQALGRYRAALDGWPECLTAARGLRRLAERLGEDDAYIDACAALGTLTIDPKERAERLVEAAERLVVRGRDAKRAEALFARALGESPDSGSAATGLVALAATTSDPGFVADALRRALERTMQPEQAIRLGSGLAAIAFDKLKDPTVGLEALRRVRKRAPGHVPTLLQMAEASMRLDLYAEAAEIAQSALGISRDAEERLRALLQLASAHAKVPDNRKDARREAEQIEKAVDTAPVAARPRWHVRVADLYASLDDRVARERAVISALVASAAARAAGASDNAPLEALERLFPVATPEGAAATFRALEEAMRRAKSASAAPDPSLLAALGKVEAVHLGRPREGVAKIREAIRSDPSRVESYAALCDIYAALGSHEDAVEDLLSILPNATARALPLAKALPVLDLLARTCQAAGRTAQAAAARQAVAYLSGAATGTQSAAPLPAPGALSKPVLTTLLSPVRAWMPWLELCGILAELAPKVLRVDTVALGVASRDRLPPRASHALRALGDQLSPAFDEPRFDLWVDAGAIGVPRLLATEPPLIVLPRGYGDLPPNEQAAGIGRLLAYLALECAWIEDLGAGDLQGWLFGALRVGDENWQKGKLTAEQESDAETWRARLAKVSGRKQKRALEDLAARATDVVEPEVLRIAVRTASIRAAFLVTGDLASTLNHFARIDRALSQLPRGALPEKLFADLAARDLVFFTLTREALALRKSMAVSPL